MANDTQARLKQAAQRAGINPGNAEQVMALATQALQNPDSYQQVAQHAVAMGFQDIPPAFDERFLNAVVMIAQNELSAQPAGGGVLEQLQRQFPSEAA